MGVLETAKDVVQIVQKIDNIELYKQILELQSEAIKIVEENLALRDQVRELEDKLRIKDKLTYELGCYWIATSDGREGPFCTHCWDRDNKLVRLTPTPKASHFFCMTHKDKDAWTVS